jgi:aminoglycoside 3-N-acetyltransferase
MPTFTWSLFHDRDATAVTFDLVNTPSNTGHITEVFRKRPGAIRSEHVCHSVAAIGPRARDVMGEGVRSFGPGSTFEQLYELDAQYLFLGVSFGVCSALHAVEESMQVPYRYYRDFVGSVLVRTDGQQVPSKSVEFLRHPEYGNHFEKMGAVFAEAGILHTTRIGEADVTLATIRDIIDVAKRLVAADPYYLTKP